MHKKPKSTKPRLVQVRDRAGDELPLPRLAQELIDGDRAAIRAAIAATSGTTVREDLMAVRLRQPGAPMATRLGQEEEVAWKSKADYRLDDVIPPSVIGRAVLNLLLMVASFIAGVAVGRLG